MQIYTALKPDYKKIEAILKELEMTPEAAQVRRKTLLQKLTDSFEPHLKKEKLKHYKEELKVSFILKQPSLSNLLH